MAAYSEKRKIRKVSFEDGRWTKDSNPETKIRVYTADEVTQFEVTYEDGTVQSHTGVQPGSTVIYDPTLGTLEITEV